MKKPPRDGDDTAGLLRYLYGPGKRDEHVNARMVAAWDVGVPDPARSPQMTISDLALLLDAPVHALLGKRPKRHVYHVAVRAAPEDRILSDDEWAQVAREMMQNVDLIGPHQGCRWVAVRHADDHIHLVATKGREDGRQPNLKQDLLRLHKVAGRYEVQWGLRRLARGDRTAVRWARTGEVEKAARRSLPTAARVELHRRVRLAAAEATSESDFFARVAAAGVRVRPRTAPDGTVTGYSVALPGDRDQKSTAVWFPGTKLAPDLSLPRVQERWAGPPVRAVVSQTAWRVAEEKVREAAAHLGAGGLARGAGDVAALGDLVVVAAEKAPVMVREQIRDAAIEYERAARAPGARELRGEARALYQSSSQSLSMAAASAGRSDTAAVLGFLVALVAAVEASRQWHQAQTYEAQAQAAGRAGSSLRVAVEVTAGAVAQEARKSVRPARRSVAVRDSSQTTGRMEKVVREAVPSYAQKVLADAAWPTLRNHLLKVERVGDSPVEVLARVAEKRELSSAESAAEVLSWRVQGWLRSSASPSAAKRLPTSSSPRKDAAPRPERAPGGERQPKGPRRSR